jgi:hypothetical protein
MDCYYHNVPGRLRLKNPAFKNRNIHDNIRKLLSNLTGIGTTDFNTVTGSIVISYNPAQVSCQDIISSFQRAGYFEPEKAINNDQYIHKAASKAGSLVGKVVLGAFVEKAFEGSALSLLSILL